MGVEAQTETTLKIMQWNINGIRNSDKLFAIMRMHDIDIAIIQGARVGFNQIEKLRDDAHCNEYSVSASIPTYRNDGSVFDGNVTITRIRAGQFCLESVD